MHSLSNRPMRLLLVEFDELHARHRCRHSQLGINVVHLIALFAIWYAIYGLLFWLAGIEWVLAVPALAYLAAIVPNVPLRVLTVAALFLALVCAAVLFLPAPWWAYLFLIPVAYKLQAWSHDYFTVAFDMTDFNKKYTKGFVLFVVLLIYEVPLALNLLLFAPAPPMAMPEPTRGDQERAAASAS